MKTDVKVCDAMTEQPISVSPDSSIRDCAKTMHKEKVGGVLVKDNGNLLGIITEQDIVHKSVIKDSVPSKVLARDIMDSNVQTIGPAADIFEAIMMMRDRNVRHLPVMNGRKFVGLLTLKDVLKIEPQLFELLAEKMDRREEERKPINNPTEEEGLCELCGKYSDNIIEFAGSKVCRPCKEEL